MSHNNANTEKVVRNVIQVLHDGQKGFAAIGGEIHDEAARLFFLEESQVRAEFAAELENELHRLGVHDVKEGGTAAGAVHRFWGEVKSKLGGGDHTLLATSEQGEDEAKKSYADALKEDLPGTVKDLLITQQAHILKSHDLVKALRDATAA